MNPDLKSSLCSCDPEINRRQFLKNTAVAAAVLGGLSATPPLLSAASKASSLPQHGESETLVTTLFKTLTEEQRKAIVFPYDHELRSKVDNNWQITDKTISEFYNQDQQAMIREIFMKLHSPDYAAQVYKQVVDDGEKHGFGGCAIAIFGEPGTGKFEFVLSGRHCTRRCDGDSVAGTAFGGPIFYGHAAQGDTEKPDHPGNVYWYQAKKANEVFQMLDGKQREMALLGRGRSEEGTKTVQLTGKRSGLPGIPLSELKSDQKEKVRKVLADVLAPFRKVDAEESIRCIEAAGWDSLHMAFYKNQDVGNDGVWDVWQIEGPSMLSYFRGAPHVHAWLHVKQPA